MPSREQVAAFVQQVEAGEFVEAMQAYYADDATMQENNEPPRLALPGLIAHEFQTWRGDRIASERFFYNPGQMRPAASAS